MRARKEGCCGSRCCFGGLLREPLRRGSRFNIVTTCPQLVGPAAWRRNDLLYVDEACNRAQHLSDAQSWQILKYGGTHTVDHVGRRAAAPQQSPRHISAGCDGRPASQVFKLFARQAVLLVLKRNNNLIVCVRCHGFRFYGPRGPILGCTVMR